MIIESKTLLRIFLFVALFTAWGMQRALALEAGSPAPEVELPGTGGTVVKISKQSGKVLYVDFWASWCGPCRQSFPWMNEMQEKYKGQGFQVIGINLDAQADDADKFLAKVPAKFTVAYDSKGSSAKLYGVKGMPTSLLIGRDGKVIYQHMGFNGESREKLEQIIQSSFAAQK